MSPIGEALLATTGVMVALEPGPVEPKIRDIRKADKLPVRTLKRAEEYVEGAATFKTTVAAKPLPYERLLELLTEPVTEARLLENVAGWPDLTLASEYATALGRAWGYLQAHLPIKVRQTITGPVNVRPPDLELARFARAFRVVESPESVLDRMDEGALLRGEADVLWEVYPEIAGLWQNQFAIALTEGRVKHGEEWRIPWRRQQQIRALLRTPKGPIEAKTAKAVKALYDKSREDSDKAAKAAEGRPPQISKLPETDGELTRIQRIEITK